MERVGLHEVEYAVGWSAWLDLTPGGVSKASALEEVRQHLGVQPHATVAVGDGCNDVQMLRWAARGVAMGHASEAVRAAADEVTGTHRGRRRARGPAQPAGLIAGPTSRPSPADDRRRRSRAMLGRDGGRSRGALA